MRRECGLQANPWTAFPRLIASIDWAKQGEGVRLLRDVLPPHPTFPRRFDLLIVDEAHNVAPTVGKYAVESLRTRLVRLLAPHFQHKLFLTATPHDGYTESFTALLELLDDQRFSRNILPPEAARALVPDMGDFPCVVTRDLDRAREWLRTMWSSEPTYRTGLVSTSEDQRLRAYGIEPSSSFRIGYPFDKWFLSTSSDVRSSFALEVAASEFECQGLELDWVGMCWGGDLTPNVGSSDWDYRKFRGAGWQTVRRDIERTYVRNRYRVLLTRARRGMVIWVPRGSHDDPRPKEIQQVRGQLRSLDGERDGVVARIGRVLSYPPTANGNVKRYRFGIGLLGISIFTMQLVFMLPHDTRRWMVAAFAATTFVVGIWQIDKAKTR